MATTRAMTHLLTMQHACHAQPSVLSVRLPTTALNVTLPTTCSTEYVWMSVPPSTTHSHPYPLIHLHVLPVVSIAINA